MNIFVNEILEEVSSQKVYRVLWTDQNNMICYLIDINDTKALPFRLSVNDITDSIAQDAFRKLKKDPVILTLSPSEKEMAMRDNAWEFLKNIVEKEPEIYISSRRGKLVEETISNFEISKPAIYKYLRKYWQRGKTPNALLPDYKNSGGRGKNKAASTLKRGKPRVYDNKNGMNVDESIRKLFRLSIEKFYLTDKKISLSEAYRMMIKKYFADDYYYEDGEQKVIIKENNQIPTKRQFRYWFRKEFSIENVKRKRLGSRMYEKDHRAVLGSSTNEAYGPGARFQIDATVADVFLISSYNSDWIIGRPVLYFVVDVFSRMITGMYIGLEGPSWAGAMMALANTVSDKAAFCNQYGKSISKEVWPCEHLPDVLMADRGELEGYNVEPLINNFNLHVENAAPYRADWKGIVEKGFDLVQQKVKPFLPGYIDKDYRQRGAEDYRLKARLTIDTFTKIIIEYVLKYNATHWLKNYELDEDMIADDVNPIPLELWNWGIRNRTGKLKYYSSDIVKLNLLPRSKATITHRGIKLKNMFYSCDKAIKESWFPEARHKGSWKVTVSYDPRDVTNIYLIDNDGRSFETCQLLERSKKYKGKTLDEVVYLNQYEKIKEREAAHQQLQYDVDLINGIENIVKPAVKKVNKEQTKNLSKSERTGSIKKNRIEEKAQRRKQEVFNIENRKDHEPGNVVPFDQTKDGDDPYKLPSIKDVLRRRKKRD